MTGRRHFANQAQSQRHPRVGIIETRSTRSGTGEAIAAASNQVQAAGLIGTLRPLRTNRAAVSFINQPELDAGHVRLSLLHGTQEELLQQVLHRLLMGDIQEQVRGEIRIEPIIAN